MKLMTPFDKEVYTEALAYISTVAKDKGNKEIEKEAFELSMNLYGKEWELDYIENKMNQYREALNV